MKIAIVDDEIDFCLILKHKIEELFPNEKNEISYFLKIDQPEIFKKFDLVFLDVLIDGKDCFSQGQHLLDLYPDLLLVYISVMDHFVYDSFEQNAFFFIRKSCLQDDLIKFYHKYERIQEKKCLKVTLKINNSSFDILQHDIIYVESQRNKIFIYTTSQMFQMYCSLKKFYEQLDTRCCYRLNASEVINLEKVVSFDDEYILMANDEKIYFTRGSKEKFIHRFLEFKRGSIWNQ